MDDHGRILRRLRGLRSRGLVTGWLIDLSTIPEVQMVANDPRQRDTSIRITTRSTEQGGLGLRATLTFARVPNLRAHTSARDGRDLAPQPPRTRPAPLKSVAALLDTPVGPAIADTGCACCGQTSPTGAELDLTCTELCFGCAQWHSAFAEVLPDPRCPHHLDPWGVGEGWRDDPRAALGDPALVALWLRDQGYRAICRSASRWDAYTLAPDPRKYSDEVACDTHSGRWTVRDVRGGEAPLAHAPARHELRDLLIALRAGEPADQVATGLPSLASGRAPQPGG